MDLLLVDGSNLAYRAHYATRDLTTSDGRASSAMFGFTSMLTNFLSDIKPRGFVVAWEGDGSTTWRKQAMPAYKAHRSKQPVEITSQMLSLEAFVNAAGGSNMAISGTEADDVIATLVKQAIAAAQTVGIVSTDKDLLALLAPGVTMYRPTRGGGYETWDYNRFKSTYEFEPELWQVRTALAGDSSDGIPGVKSIGEKTAFTLIKDWGSLDSIYENIDKITPARCQQLLRDGQDSAYLSYRIAGMLEDLPIQFNEINAERPADMEAIRAHCKDWELSSIIERVERVLSAR